MPERNDEGAAFEEYARTRDRRLRNRLVEAHIGLARRAASRMGARRQDGEDLHQVALLGLVKAVDRFDPSRGFAFSTFATATIEGELKRHLRDTAWAVRVPRSAKDLHVSVRRVSTELAQDLGRSPTVGELAGHLGVDPDDVVAALAAGDAQRTSSLDAPGEGVAPDHVAATGERDVEIDRLEDRVDVSRLMEVLPEREREIVRLRFGESLSQEAIAERMQMSQMHVSRLLRRSFEAMRIAAGRRD